MASEKRYKKNRQKRGAVLITDTTFMEDNKPVQNQTPAPTIPHDTSSTDIDIDEILGEIKPELKKSLTDPGKTPTAVDPRKLEKLETTKSGTPPNQSGMQNTKPARGRSSSAPQLQGKKIFLGFKSAMQLKTMYEALESVEAESFYWISIEEHTTKNFKESCKIINKHFRSVSLLVEQLEEIASDDLRISEVFYNEEGIGKRYGQISRNVLQILALNTSVTSKPVMWLKPSPRSQTVVAGNAALMSTSNTATTTATTTATATTTTTTIPLPPAITPHQDVSPRLAAQRSSPRQNSPGAATPTPSNESDPGYQLLGLGKRK
jgi:hypothetical protein